MKGASLAHLGLVLEGLSTRSFSALNLLLLLLEGLLLHLLLRVELVAHSLALKLILVLVIALLVLLLGLKGFAGFGTLLLNRLELELLGVRIILSSLRRKLVLRQAKKVRRG